MPYLRSPTLNGLYLDTPLRESTPLDALADCARPHAIPGVIVDGQDVIAVEAAVSEAIARARAETGHPCSG